MKTVRLTKTRSNITEPPYDPRAPAGPGAEGGRSDRRETRERPHYQYEPGVIFSFTIFGKRCNAHVRMKCVRRIGCTMQELERELADLLAAIRLTASGQRISRELWLCSPRYAWRFFRVQDTGLVELDGEGMGLGTGA